MIKNKIFNYLLMITISFCAGSFQYPQLPIEPTIGEIYNFAKNIPAIDSTRKVARWVDYQSFDFNTLTPMDSTHIKHKDYFRVGYDYANKIISVRHIEDKWHLGNFEMYFYYHSNFVVGTAKSFEDTEEGSFLDGIFAIFPSQKKSYFITLRSNIYFNDTILRLGIHYDNRDFELGKIEDISVIMVLNKKFFAEYLFKISYGRILYVSKPIYSEQKGLRLLFEQLWGYNCSQSFNFSPQNQLRDIDKIIEQNCLHWFGSVKSPFNSNYCLPLWMNSGIYQPSPIFIDEEEVKD